MLLALWPLYKSPKQVYVINFCRQRSVFFIKTTICFYTGTTTVDPRRPVFTSTPSRSNSVLVGRNIKLEWSFKIQSVNDLSEISLHSYEPHSKAKKKIALKNVKSGEFLYRTGFKGRYVCEISFTEDGIGRASITISNVQFNQTYDYGISMKLKGKGHVPLEKFVSVQVVGKGI